MSKEAMKLALRSIRELVIDESDDAPALQGVRMRKLAAEKALREALAEQKSGIKQVIELYDSPDQPAQQEPVAWLIWLHGPAGHFDNKQFAELEFERRNKEYPDPDRKLLPLYTSPPAQRTWVGLTDREIELLDGMIEVQLHHAAQCDRIANRTMADKQKGWDMERVELLRKLKEKNT